MKSLKNGDELGVKTKFFSRTFCAFVVGGLISGCSKIDPQVREILSSLQPPVVEPPAPEPEPEPALTGPSFVEQTLGGFASYQVSPGAPTGVAPAPYWARLEVASDVPVAAQKTPTRHYQVIWDAISGDELAEEGVLDGSSGFNP